MKFVLNFLDTINATFFVCTIAVIKPMVFIGIDNVIE